MKIIKNYKHRVASHCESGSVRNLLSFEGFEISEPMLFGIGSGVVFAYMKMIKGPGGFSITAIRLPMGKIVENAGKKLGVKFYYNKLKTVDDAIKKLNALIDSGKPSAICVDMFYMNYLPPFMHVHAPFHFIVPVGREGDTYGISDPYYDGIGELNVESLKSAWETHALFAKDNFLAYIEEIPDPKSIDWKKIIIQSLKKQVNMMVIPPVIKNILPIFGIEGIKFFAKEMLGWTKKYRGLALREGMLFTPTILEEQGTGGGAFRMLYAAFLQEAKEVFNSSALGEIADRMTLNADKWRDASRHLIKIAKEVPIDNNEFDGWFNKNKLKLEGHIAESSKLFVERALDEESIFKSLKKVMKGLK